MTYRLFILLLINGFHNDLMYIWKLFISFYFQCIKEGVILISIIAKKNNKNCKMRGTKKKTGILHCLMIFSHNIFFG